MDKFEDLQAFVSVVESGSFTAAAERLDADKSAIRVACREGILRILVLQRPGGKALGVADFLNGMKLDAGTRLENANDV